MSEKSATSKDPENDPHAADRDFTRAEHIAIVAAQTPIAQAALEILEATYSSKPPAAEPAAVSILRTGMNNRLMFSGVIVTRTNAAFTSMAISLAPTCWIPSIGPASRGDHPASIDSPTCLRG